MGDVIILPDFDINNDGRKDYVFVKWKSRGVEKKVNGEKAIFHVDYFETDVYINHDKNSFRTLLKGSPCKKSDNTLLFHYPRGDIRFYDPKGIASFVVGQTVMSEKNGTFGKIKGFQVEMDISPRPLSTRAILGNCNEVSLDDLAWVTPAGKRLSADVAAGLARCDMKEVDGCKDIRKNATAAENRLARLYVDALKYFLTAKFDKEGVEQFLTGFLVGQDTVGGPLADVRNDERLYNAILSSLEKYLEKYL